MAEKPVALPPDVSAALQAAVGKTIQSVDADSQTTQITFSDGEKLEISIGAISSNKLYNGDDTPDSAVLAINGIDLDD